MVSDVLSFVDVIERVGVPALFLLIFAWLCFKSAPSLLDTWQQSKREEQQYYRDRQSSYERQMTIISGIAEQGNLLISQSNEIIRQNTEVIKQNNVVHEKVITAVGNDLHAIRELTASMQAHDKRSEDIHTNTTKLLERTK